MPVARTHSVALLGIDGAVVEIEADISGQLPNFVLIGLPDAALGEARERVRAAAALVHKNRPSRWIPIAIGARARTSRNSCRLSSRLR